MKCPQQIKQVRLVGILCLWLVSPVQAASGSWVGEVTGVRLFTPGRAVDSGPIQPPGAVAAEAKIHSLSWRFQGPVGQPQPEAWLCHPQHCMKLAVARGRTQEMMGLTANEPLYFRFQLPREAHPGGPLRVEGLQVIVNYRYD